MKRYKLGNLKIYQFPRALPDGRRWFFEYKNGLSGGPIPWHGPIRPYWIDKLASRARKCFPYWLAVGLQDCDSGGRVTSWHPVFAWNYWSMRKATRAWYGAGDGEVWETIAPSEWIAWVFRRWKEARRGRVDQEY
jgi:hypothetical protein